MGTPEPTWQPHERHGRLTTRSDLPDAVFAFPRERKGAATRERLGIAEEAARKAAATRRREREEGR
jgi:hypothetical protein